jgi:hypothetical protein
MKLTFDHEFAKLGARHPAWVCASRGFCITESQLTSRYAYAIVTVHQRLAKLRPSEVFVYEVLSA